ncbi:hypothetical protein BO70DRAFT_359652 [Aspergillus heteromorphus CBS 117.55]|uniref:Uncharacterized protein n=1 Tax=Aspergillus heteromorphus CBS 117.55 TaxID=1448321 RepID=A0A317WR44_9EURO|nr:uncharacterized protein BO70DRAFT_359652 [Aspergillus heteromorphus CBS 117.55]PWY88171.1 hypothetical protein BO70DRAFT_359652 [Aspergillus heteromorphus CBS 117.55]
MFDNVMSWFRSSAQEEVPEMTWDATTLTMVQPQSPADTMTTNEVVTDQPALGEGMELRLRGGDGEEDA